jgi:hypothetical protein
MLKSPGERRECEGVVRHLITIWANTTYYSCPENTRFEPTLNHSVYNRLINRLQLYWLC